MYILSTGYVSGVCVCVLFFFFSSRRRHTRSLCDWSSDVCSSDLRLRQAEVLSYVSLLPSLLLNIDLSVIDFYKQIFIGVSENLLSKGALVLIWLSSQV